jgi:hypothetical protein
VVSVAGRSVRSAAASAAPGVACDSTVKLCAPGASVMYAAALRVATLANSPTLPLS